MVPTKDALMIILAYVVDDVMSRVMSTLPTKLH